MTGPDTGSHTLTGARHPPAGTSRQAPLWVEPGSGRGRHSAAASGRRAKFTLTRCPANQGSEPARAIVYERAMHTFASIAIGLLMFATIAVLFAGLIGMVRGQSGATSNKLMRYRVLLQGATLLLLVIFMSLLRS